ncbi:hypothetical protein VaNZ11_013374, partial [Volvox africanus]
MEVVNLDHHDCQISSNSTFAAACHPLIYTIGDNFMSVLRLLCHGSRATADAERKRLQVSLPAHFSEQQFPEPRHLQSLLSRLRNLAHVTISQNDDDTGFGPAVTSPGQPRSTGIEPLPKSSASCHSRQHGTSLAASCYWRPVLCTLRPDHLRILELDGLVVSLWTHESGGAVGSLDLNQTAVDIGFGRKYQREHRQRRRRRRSAAETRQTSEAASMELLAQLLTRAPFLQDLALLRVTVLPADEEGEEKNEEEEEAAENHTPQLAAEEMSAETATSTSKTWRTRHQVSPLLASAQQQGGMVSGRGGKLCGTGVGWCSVSSALPAGLTSLRLGVAPHNGLRRERHRSFTRGTRATGNCSHDLGCGLNSAVHGGSSCVDCKCNGNPAGMTPGAQRHCLSCWSRQPEQLCAACLGAALRRLHRLAVLEVIGTYADIAIAALKLAVTSSAATMTTTATITARRSVP